MTTNKNGPLVTWLIEDNVFNNTEKIEQVIKEKDMACHKVDVASIRDYFNCNALKNIAENACVVVYGSVNMARLAMQKLPWTPTGWLDLKNLRCSSYLAYWGEFSLQASPVFTVWSQLLNCYHEYYRMISKASSFQEPSLFIRPDENTKLFTGEVVFLDEFEDWHRNKTECHSVCPDTLIMLSLPKIIDAEYRFVVSKNKIVTGSRYMLGGKPKVDREIPASAISLAERLANHYWQLEKAYVIDIAEHEGKHYLLEVGSVNCAGLYACDINLFVQEICNLAKEEWLEVYI